MEDRGKKTVGRERVYSFIVEFIQKNGYSPSVRDMYWNWFKINIKRVYASYNVKNDGKN